MSDWTSNATPPLPLPCEHNETGLCPNCVLDWVKSSALTADMELKRVADSAVDVMRKLQWERDQAQAQLATLQARNERAQRRSKYSAKDAEPCDHGPFYECAPCLVEQLQWERDALQDSIDSWNELNGKLAASHRRVAALESVLRDARKYVAGSRAIPGMVLLNQIDGVIDPKPAQPAPVTQCEHGRWSDRCLSCAIADGEIA